MNSSSNPAWSEKPSWEHPITPFDQSASATSPLSYLPHSQTGSTVTTSITADPPNRETTTTDKPGKSHFFHLFTFTPPRHVPLLILSIASSALCAAGRTGYVLFLGKLFELVALFGAGQLPPDVFLAQVSRWSVYLVVLGVGMWVASTLEIALWVAGGELRAKEVRGRVWEVLMKKSLGWFEAKEEGGGAFVTKILTQTRELQTASSQTLGFLVYELFVFAACVAVAFFFSFKLTLVMLATGVPSALFLWVIGQFLDPAIDAQRRELAEAAKCATAAVTAIDIVKVYNAEGQEASRFVAAVKRSAKYYSRQVLCNCAQMSYVKLWMMMLFVLGFFYAVVLVSSGELTPGTALTTFYAALVAFQSLEATGPMWLVLVKGMAAGQSLQALVRDDCSGSGESSLRADKSTGWRKPSTCSGNILMNNISFAYPSNPANTVLRPSTLRFAAGQLTFVVGRSGSGKSTLGNLLVRFYEPLTGQITLDGNPIPTLDLEWLRRNVTLVQQSSVFFHDTFFQNVAFGASDPDNVSPQAVRDACSMALLQSTIAGLPDGLLTKVGSGDCNLSGGQKQRLALARAKLRDPPVLILDEITSGLDPVSRSLIMEAIRIWRKGKTTIIITHEVGQIEEDDYVYVLADGSIVQRGFGHELSKDESGLFASLVASADETCSLADSDISNSESESDCGIPWQEPTEERRFSGFLPRFSTGSRLSWGLFQGTEWRVEPVNARETFIGPRQAPKQGHPPSGMHIVTKAGLEVQSRRALHARQTREKILTQQHQASLDSLELFFLERLAERKDKTKSPKGPEPLSMLVVLKTVWPTLDFLGKGEFILGLLLCLVLASSTPIFAFLFANLLSAFWLPEARGAASVMWSVFLTVTAVAAAASTFFSYFFMEMVAQKWVNRLRAEAIQRILSQPKPWFDSASHSASNIAQCLDRNAEEMRKLVGTFLPILLSVSAMILGAIIWALVIRWDLTLVTLVGVPLALGTARANAMISDKWETNCDEAAASTGAIFSEAYSNVKVVRALTLERYFSDKHALSARSTFRLGLKRAAWVGTFFGLYNCISYFLTSLVFFYSAKILSEGLTTVTDVIRVNNLLLFTLGTAVVLLAHVPQIAAAKTTAKRMLYYANLSHVAGHETQGGMRLSTPFPVRMTNLRFAYPSAPDKLILRNINLRIDAGTFTALVGASGCGKSTITALLLRLYEPSQGDDESNTATTRPPAPVRTSPSYSRPLTFIPSPIPESPVSQKKTIPSPSSALTFASHPASSLSTRSLRAQLGYVPQTPFLFPASVFANLTYGLPENSPLRDEANVHLAARQAGIHDFIVSLPRGYDTPLGEGGQQVSGGQAQRLCIARALVRRPRLLILDEPTSALDAQSAEAIRRIVRDLVAAQRRRSGGGSQGGMIPTEEEDVDMAVVVVTHSKEMMRVADRVVMVEDGVIVESGGYEELVRKGGKFAGLVGGGMWAPGTADGKGKGRRMVGEEKVEAEVKRSREETLYKLEGF